jgi:diguanylate cyclase
MTLVILSALCLCSICLLISVWLLVFSRNQTPAQTAEPPVPPPAAPVDPDFELIQSLQVLTRLVRQQVGEHSASVSGVGESLRKMQQDPASTAVSEVLDALNLLLATNSQLQDRLNAADRELSRQAEVIEHQRQAALTDPLTRLGNRRAFDEQFQRLRHESVPIGMVLLDLDHFKRVNDTYGHAAGDAVLAEVGSILRKSLRQEAFVARMGGEEFAALVPRASEATLAAISVRVREAIEQGSVIIEGQRIAITTSVGAALEQPDEPPADFYQRADRATYASKQAGRNCCHLHTGTAIRPILSLPMVDDAPAAASMHVASRSELIAQIRRYLLEAELETNPLALVLLQVECLECARPHALAIEEPRFQPILTAVRGAIRDGDLVAECDPGRIAVLLPGARGDRDAGPVRRLCDAVANCLADRQERLGFLLGAAQAALNDDCVSFVQRAETELQANRTRPECVIPSRKASTAWTNAEQMLFAADKEMVR